MWSCDAVMIYSSNVKIVFFWYMILGTKNSIFFDYRLSADTRNWFRQASSTDDESGCASSTRWRFAGGPICSSASQSCPAASAAAVVHSSTSHCLGHASLVRRTVAHGINDCCDNQRTGAHQLQRDKQTSKGIPPPTCYMVVQLINRANSCRYHWRVN